MSNIKYQFCFNKKNIYIHQYELNENSLKKIEDKLSLILNTKLNLIKSDINIIKSNFELINNNNNNFKITIKNNNQQNISSIKDIKNGIYDIFVGDKSVKVELKLCKS